VNMLRTAKESKSETYSKDIAFGDCHLYRSKKSTIYLGLMQVVKLRVVHQLERSV
jgi:hypothetical protein